MYDTCISWGRYYHYVVKPPGEVDAILSDLEELFKPDACLGALGRRDRINAEIDVSIHLLPHCNRLFRWVSHTKRLCVTEMAAGAIRVLREGH